MLPMTVKALTITKIYVSPKSSTLIDDVNFTIDINVELVYKMSTYQVYLYWNPKLLNVTNVIQGPFLSNYSQYATFYKVSKNDTKGELKVWEAQTTPDIPSTSVGGNGTLFSVAFLARGTGQCLLHVNNTQILYLQNLVTHDVEDGFFNNQLYNIWAGDRNFNVNVESNSTVYAFNFNLTDKAVLFNVTGFDGTGGYVNVTIPRELLDVDGDSWITWFGSAALTPAVTTNSTHTFVYLSYTHSTHQIQIIGTNVVPELPTTLSLLLTLIALTIATFLVRKFSCNSRTKLPSTSNF